MKKERRLGSRLIMGLVFLFLYAPIFLLIIFSFNEGNSNAVWTGFSLHWYKELFQNRIIMRSVYTTLLVSLMATVISTFAGTFAAIANYELLETAVAVAREKGVEPNVGSLLSSDVFYNKAGDTLKWAEMGVLAAEMESYALYCNAAEAGKRALAICTISDSIVTGAQLSAEDRQTSFRNMMEIALEVAVRMDTK